MRAMADRAAEAGSVNGAASEQPRNPRLFDTSETQLVAIIERSPGVQLRVYLVRTQKRNGGMYTFVSLARWYRNPVGDWRCDAQPFRGGPLLKPSEVVPVATAMSRAVELARQRGWTHPMTTATGRRSRR